MRWLALPAMAIVAVTPALARQLTVPAGLKVPLATTVELTSKTTVKGDIVTFRTTEDVAIDGTVVIPRDTEATGQVIDAQAKGYAGMSGMLLIRPLYLRAGGTIVRLRGSGERDPASSAGQIASFVFNPLFFTGRTATLPKGTAVVAFVEKDTTIATAP